MLSEAIEWLGPGVYRHNRQSRENNFAKKTKAPARRRAAVVAVTDSVCWWKCRFLEVVEFYFYLKGYFHRKITNPKRRSQKLSGRV